MGRASPFAVPVRAATRRHAPLLLFGERFLGASPQVSAVDAVLPGMTGAGVITTRTARLWIGDDQLARVDCLPGVEHTGADARENLEGLWELAGQRRLPARVDMRRARATSRDARSTYGGPEGERVHSAVAIMVASPLSRALGSFFMSLHQPLYPTRLFTSEPDALAWLRTFLV